MQLLTPQLLQQELPMLVAQGCSSLKLYMTYDDMRLDDRQICIGCGRHIVEIAAAGVAAERKRTEKL